MQGGHAGLSRVGTDSSRSVWSGEDVVDAIFGHGLARITDPSHISSVSSSLQQKPNQSKGLNPP